MYLIGKGPSKRVRWRGFIEDGPSDGEDPTEEIPLRRSVREGPPEKMVAGEGLTEKIRRRRFVAKGLLERDHRRWSIGEDPMKKIRQRRSD